MRYFITFLLPVLVTCAVFINKTETVSGFWVVVFLLLAEGVLYCIYKRLKNNAVEFISGNMCTVEHYFPWVERVVRDEYRRDNNGNQYKVQVEKYVNHPDEYVGIYNINHKHYMSRDNFEYMCWRWGFRMYSFKTNHKNCVEGGGGEACDWNGDENSTKTVTITHRYHNPLKKSYSLFRSSGISKERVAELGLFDYPKLDSYDEQKVLLVKDGVPFSNDLEQAAVALQRLNAFCGETSQIHVFMLLVPASDGIEFTACQKDYWKGLNKNELVICLGVSNNMVRWCEAMSWSDNKTLELKIRSYFIDHPTLNLTPFVAWLRANLKYWKRKEFKDFEYLKNGEIEGGYWILLSVSILFSLMLWFLCH